MIAPLHLFAQALQMPHATLDRLREAEVVCTSEGLPALHRTTSYVEAEIRWQGASYLLMMPLSTYVQHRMEHRLNRLMRLQSDHLAEIRLLDRELSWYDVQDNERRCDLLLHSLPGLPFEVGSELIGADRTIEAIDRLEQALCTLGCSHNNLKPSNLRFVGDRLVALRPFAAEFGDNHGTDQADLEQLRKTILETARRSSCVEDVGGDYVTPVPIEGHRFVGNEFEGLYCIEEESGYGYVDRENRIVIAPQFLWADDFHENRAVVETLGGMGVIDRTGAYILPPRYTMIEYLHEESRFKALADGHWLFFDYCGRCIGEADSRMETTNYSLYGTDQNSHYR